jgi:excisionase family DNA binding protein
MSKTYLTQTAVSIPSQTENQLPLEWLRVKEACAYSRLSKPTLYGLLNRGEVKSVSLRQRGQTKGTRLVSYDSLRAFLEAHSTGGSTSTSETP